MRRPTSYPAKLAILPYAAQHSEGSSGHAVRRLAPTSAALLCSCPAITHMVLLFGKQSPAMMPSLLPLFLRRVRSASRSSLQNDSRVGTWIPGVFSGCNVETGEPHRFGRRKSLHERRRSHLLSQSTAIQRLFGDTIYDVKLPHASGSPCPLVTTYCRVAPCLANGLTFSDGLADHPRLRQST